MKYLIVAVAAAVLLYLIRPLTPAMTTTLQPNDTILAAGDSLTYGFGAAPEQSYPALLSKMTGIRVVNAGINGETSAEGLRRLPGLLQKHRPKLTILCYGGNDILQKLPMAQLKANLVKMVSLCKTHGSEVLLISVPNLTLFGLEPLSLYEEVAEETGTPLLEGVLADILDKPALKSDQIHPNAKGYKAMAEAIYRKLVEEGFISP